MKQVGIESISAYCGVACVDVGEVYRARGFDAAKAGVLLMGRKTVAVPGEDVVSYAVNAAAPLIGRLTDDERHSIELLVIGTESGLDFSKSVGTWVHELLGLPRSCRLFEVKQACYGGVAALQLAAAQMAVSPLADARALVIASDVPRLDGESPHGEPTVGAGAVAVLVGGSPALAVAELGASGYHSFDVGDYFRPTPTHSVLDTDLSLLAYVQGLKNCRADYARRRPDLDFLKDFDHLAFHVPVPAVVKGAHRSLSRDLGVRTAREVTDDFRTRLEPSLRYPAEVGNIWAASTLLALASVLDNAKTVPGQRLGIYSYGSGCSAEFCSYLVGPGAPAATGIDESLLARTEVDIATYERLVTETGELYSGLADHLPDLTDLRRFAAEFPRPVVALAGIRDHVREYVTVGAAT